VPRGRGRYLRVCVAYVSSTSNQDSGKRGLFDIPQKTPNNMLQQPHRLLIHQLRHHVTKHSPHGIEPLIRLANILQTHVVEQNLLDDEDSNRLAEFRAGLHDTQTERDDFGGEEEVDDFAAVVFDEGADDAEGGEAQVFEGAGFGGGVEEGVEEEGDVC